MLNYLVSPDLSASAEFNDSLEANALRAVPAYGMSEYYDPTEANEAYGEDDDFGDNEDDDFGDDEDDDFGDDEDDDFGDDEFGDEDEDDFGDEDEDDFGDDDEDDFGDDEDDEFGAPVGFERTNYARLAREVTGLISKGKRGLPKTQAKIARLRQIWSSLEGKPNGTSGLDAPWQILQEAPKPSAAAPAAPGLRKVAPKVMPGLPPIRTVAPVGIPATNADRIIAERAAASGPGRATSRAEARSRFKLRGPDIIAQMKNYTIEKLTSIASNPNRGPEVRQAARDELARRRAGRPAPAPAAAPPAPGRPVRPVIVVRPGRPGRPAAPASAPAAPFMTGPSETPTFGVVPRIVAADNVFDAIGAFKAEAALLGLGVFLLGTYAGPPLFRRLTR